MRSVCLHTEVRKTIAELSNEYGALKAQFLLGSRSIYQCGYLKQRPLQDKKKREF